MSRVALGCAVALVVLALAPSGGAAGGSVVAGAGVASYSIVKDGIPPTCAGDGAFTVTYEATARTMLVAGSAVGCVPIWSLVSQCLRGDDGTIRCFHSGIDITFAPDGRFDYVWHDAAFHEEIHGWLDRVG